MSDDIDFTGTRGSTLGFKPRSFSKVFLDPAAPFGGIYSPEVLPCLDPDFLENCLDKSYKFVANGVLKSFGIDLSLATIRDALSTYDSFDNPKNPVPVVEVGNVHVAELFHGPTRAFKDLALAPFTKTTSLLAQELQKIYLIMVATSGDTGPALLNGLAGKANTFGVCLYPDGKTSVVQKLQMITAEAPNLRVIGVRGNFDDAQNELKRLLASSEFRAELADRGIELSAANSVNFGRIIFQIVYHIWTYLELVRKGTVMLGVHINLFVPSGNFGNGLAAYFAKKMGLHINKIILSSNANNVLTEFIQRGVYDLRTRRMIETSSPAMDILLSSNIERLLFDLYGSARTKDLMHELKHRKMFVLSDNELKLIHEHFDAGYATDKQVDNMILDVFQKLNYVIDPHTATAFCVRSQFLDYAYPVIYATAEWTKFSSVMARVHDCSDDLDVIAEKMGVTVPKAIKKLFRLPIRHKVVAEVSEVADIILDFIDSSLSH